MGLFSFAAGLIGGGKAKKASRKADAAMMEYLDKAIGEQQRQFDVTREDYSPYRTTGLAGLTGLGDLVGVNGDAAQSAGLLNIQNSPALASIIRNGEEAVLQNASATGGIRGGNTQRGLADFRSDAFVDQLNQQIARLAGLTGIGQGATDAVSQFGAQKAASVADLLNLQGQTKKQGILTRGGINASLWNNAGKFADSIASSIFGGPAGAASSAIGSGASSFNSIFSGAKGF
jgi:hypothetical protein